MNDTWKTFIQSQGAVLDSGRVRDFGDPAEERRAAAQGNVLADLSDLPLIQARGADTQNFLNGQLSNDLRRLDATHSQLAAWCSPKGRMLVIFRLLRRGDDTLLQLPSSLLEPTLKRMRMFVLRAKVTLESADDELVSFGISGPDAEKILHDSIGFAPTEINGSETRDEITIARLPGPHPRFEIIAPVEVAKKTWNGLKDKTRPVGPAVWAWLDIMAGIPSVHPETSEAFVPQMANLEIVLHYAESNESLKYIPVLFYFDIKRHAMVLLRHIIPWLMDELPNAYEYCSAPDDWQRHLIRQYA